MEFDTPLLALPSRVPTAERSDAAEGRVPSRRISTGEADAKQRCAANAIDNGARRVSSGGRFRLHATGMSRLLCRPAQEEECRIPLSTSTSFLHLMPPKTA